MVGNIADAALILSDYRAHNAQYLYSRAGSTRMVFLKDDVIYKVDMEEGTNALEFDNINLLKNDLPANVRFPETSLYSVKGEDIIAMEYIDGQAMARCSCWMTGETCFPDCAPADVIDFMRGYEMDSAGMNIIGTNGIYYIVDAG